jgi:hypothetical protein
LLIDHWGAYFIDLILGTTLGLSFYLQHRNTGMLPRESPTHVNRHIMVHAEYGLPTRSPNQIS